MAKRGGFWLFHSCASLAFVSDSACMGLYSISAVSLGFPLRIKKDILSVIQIESFVFATGVCMKKILALLLCLVCVFSVSAKSKKRESVKIVQTKSKYSVQVVMPELENISGNEKNWLGGQIRDKFKSNLQEFLGMETFVDSKSEAALIKIQKEIIQPAIFRQCLSKRKALRQPWSDPYRPPSRCAACRRRYRPRSLRPHARCYRL